MLLDLREIIELPGGKVSFEFEPDLSNAIGGSITQFQNPVIASGAVENKAGLLTFTCKLSGMCICACARCLKEFKYPIDTVITANITEHGIGEDPNGYYLQGNELDILSIITTEFILNIDDVLLCSDTCKGLCHKCGTDLNEGKCDCKQETDPRLAVLKQLLD